MIFVVFGVSFRVADCFEEKDFCVEVRVCSFGGRKIQKNPKFGFWADFLNFLFVFDPPHVEDSPFEARI